MFALEGKVRDRIRQMVVAVAACAIASSPASGAWLDPCTAARLVASWKHDGLWRTPAIDDPPKSLDGHRVRYVGKLHAGGRTYRIYYDQNSDPDTAAPHGHSDVVVTTGTGKFLGLYDIDSAEPMRTAGADILFNWKKKNGDRIHFGRNGPPGQVYVAGDLFDFSTPTGYRLHSPDEKPWPEPGPRVESYCRR